MRPSLSCLSAKICSKTKDKVGCRLLLDVVLRDDTFADEDLHTSIKINDEDATVLELFVGENLLEDEGQGGV